MARRNALLLVEADQVALRRIEAKLAGTGLYADGLRRAMRETVEEGHRTVQRRAPLGQTHALWGSISHAIDPSPLPVWAKVTADATNRGFRYGWALQGSKKLVYRYRSGSRVGKPTRRWFTGAKPRMRKILRAQIELMVRAIEAKWRSV